MPLLLFLIRRQNGQEKGKRRKAIPFLRESFPPFIYLIIRSEDFRLPIMH